MKLAGQRNNLLIEQVDGSFIYNQLFIKHISQYVKKNATEAICYNLFFQGHIFCPAVPLTSHVLPLVIENFIKSIGCEIYTTVLIDMQIF